MTETELAYWRLWIAVWQAGVTIWADRWLSAIPAPETSQDRALKARASFRVVV